MTSLAMTGGAMSLNAARMARTFGIAPTLDNFEVIARAAMARLPAAFMQQVGEIILQVTDFADDDVLADMDIDQPFALTGLYEGVPLTERSIAHSGALPDRISLFRLPILLEWCERGDESLEHLIAHVVVHEIGHHFGLSDEDMHALEDQVR